MSTKQEKEAIVLIRIDQIQPFPNHPFQVNEDEAMERLKESIAENGVLMPAIVRQMSDGSFQMVSGHRRMAACKALGIEKMPAIVRDMDDDLATVTMVDANSQREQILPSEKAHAYKMRHDALKHMRAAGTVPANGRTTEQVGRENSKSFMTITRYIRMTRLLPDLLKLVDSKKLKFTSSNEKVAVVDSEGIITTEGQGIADITAQTKDGRQKAVIRLRVKKNAVSGWSGSFESQSEKDVVSVWQRSTGDGSM